jgi:uncharacterized protein (TIGR03382 family)
LSASGVLPAWLTFNPATGELSGTPANVHANKPYTVTLVASNGVSPDAVQTFTIDVDRSPDAKKSDSDEDGCAAGGNGQTGVTILALLAALAGLGIIMHRRATRA